MIAGDRGKGDRRRSKGDRSPPPLRGGGYTVSAPSLKLPPLSGPSSSLGIANGATHRQQPSTRPGVYTHTHQHLRTPPSDTRTVPFGHGHIDEPLQ